MGVGVGALTRGLLRVVLRHVHPRYIIVLHLNVQKNSEPRWLTISLAQNGSLLFLVYI